MEVLRIGDGIIGMILIQLIVCFSGIVQTYFPTPISKAFIFGVQAILIPVLAVITGGLIEKRHIDVRRIFLSTWGVGGLMAYRLLIAIVHEKIDSVFFVLFSIVLIVFLYAGSFSGYVYTNYGTFKRPSKGYYVTQTVTAFFFAIMWIMSIYI